MLLRGCQVNLDFVPISHSLCLCLWVFGLRVWGWGAATADVTSPVLTHDVRQSTISLVY